MKRFLLFCFLIIGFTSFAETTVIKDINENPSAFNNKFVTVKGVVIQHSDESSSSTKNYALKGDFGGVIIVNTNSSLPETNKKYVVTGTVVGTATSNAPILVEDNRTLLTPPAKAAAPLTPAPTVDEETSYTNYVVIGIAGFALLVLIALYFILKKKNTTNQMPREESESKAKTEEAKERPQPKTASTMNNDQDFKTIKIVTDDAPKTMKLIPGFLEITTGPDTGKKFSITGFPTPEGNIISIGREKVEGEKKYAHIQLNEQTVSRKQAEIISNGSLLQLRNLSSTNPTQLNGNDIQPGQKVILVPESVIKAGNIEFTYRAN